MIDLKTNPHNDEVLGLIDGFIKHQFIQGKTALRVLLAIHTLNEQSKTLSKPCVTEIRVRLNTMMQRDLTDFWIKQSLNVLVKNGLLALPEENGRVKITTNGIELSERLIRLTKKGEGFERYADITKPAEIPILSDYQRFIQASNFHLQSTTV